MIYAHSNTGSEPMMRSMMGDDGPMSGGMVFMGLFWLVVGLLLLAVLILGIIALIRYLKKGVNKAALDMLKGRYAKGEISREEFKAIKKDIEDKK